VSEKGRLYESGGDTALSSELTCEAAAATDPGDRMFGDPALGQHDEAVVGTAAHDLALQCPVRASAAAI
jgi:hypothetical protein